MHRNDHRNKRPIGRVKGTIWESENINFSTHLLKPFGNAFGNEHHTTYYMEHCMDKVCYRLSGLVYSPNRYE